MEIYFNIAVFGGAALMVTNIVRYFLFARALASLDGRKRAFRVLLYLPNVLLISFLIGYILVGILDDNKQDWVVPSILLGGSIFVAVLLEIMFRIIDKIRGQIHQNELRYDETEREVKELSSTALAFFRVNLTHDLVLNVGGSDLYECDTVGSSYEQILSARSVNLVSRFDSKGCHSFHREDLIAHFRAGHETASEIVLCRREDRPAAFVFFKATMAEDPATGDVIAFIVEEDYNEKMILDTILNRALSYRYDIVCSIIEGRYHLIATGTQEGAKAILPEEDLGTYQEFCQSHVRARLPKNEDVEAVMSSLRLEKVEEELKKATSYEASVRIWHEGKPYYKRFTFYNVTTDTQFFVLLVQDTTGIHEERARQNEKLSAALEQARMANESKTVFFSNMSHDIRTPMNAIMGFSALAKRSDDVEKIHYYMDKVERSGSHLLSLINDVLEMSRIESGKIELDIKPVNLGKTLDDVHDLFTHQMEEKGIDFAVDKKGVQDLEVLIDPYRFNRVLLNLVSNAYKFTPKGGKVSVKATSASSDDPDKVKIEVSVKDTGIGMSEEFAKHVFEAYERENKATVTNTQGSGLGMAIAKSIIDLVGGNIDVKTAPGKGTEFIIHLELPLAKNAKGEDQSESVVSEALPHFDGKRVLLADDSEINREIAEILLTEIGFMVESANNGKEACDMLFSKPSDYYDILLLDVQMPVMDGLEASRSIRAHADKRIASLPIVAFTANAFKEDWEMAKEAGMDVFLCKPATQEQMAEAFVEAFDIAKKK